MSVCSATAAASSRPGRRGSRSSSTRASTTEQQFYIGKSGLKPLNQRRAYCSTCIQVLVTATS
ncbi:hypothetical protein MAR_036524 [Mya arenaria]|uniref:Uncharacterized protein n=1 Tax=Mya arenaria TaxID=6604 RepID=A0ABY7FKW9_MYAAR|nr:hypothetical protein MAR_036524 [Mya arenaria]